MLHRASVVTIRGLEPTRDDEDHLAPEAGMVVKPGSRASSTSAWSRTLTVVNCGPSTKRPTQRDSNPRISPTASTAKPTIATGLFLRKRPNTIRTEAITMIARARAFISTTRSCLSVWALARHHPDEAAVGGDLVHQEVGDHQAQDALWTTPRIPGSPCRIGPKRGRFDQRLARKTRAPATTSTANPATRPQLPHHMSWLTRPTTMRIPETTASRVASGRDIARDIAWFLRSVGPMGPERAGPSCEGYPRNSSMNRTRAPMRIAELA